ncbi:MAG TPA: efflux RND transporter periplasmic adaptor subunit [Vitreimonas sp.]|nr:efflux RND transporter periplasmic adaptor subunit [Vitreimonas sp.]
MNKPERPELFTQAQGLLKRVGDAGGRALRNARSVGERAWKGEGEPDEVRRSRRVVLLTAAGVIAALVAISVLTRIGGGGAERVAVDTRQAVTVVRIEPRLFSPTITLTGEARPTRDIQVTAPATGVRILELLVDEGQTVRAGQAMARLDTDLAQAQTRAAQAAVAEAQSAAVRARGEYQRAESIRDSGALSAEAIEQRRAAAIAADARLAAARAQLQETNARLGGGYVRAPASGLVIDRSAEIGRSVDGQVLFRIAAGSQLEVATQVAEADILAMQPGQPAVFELVDGTTVQARLTRLPASVDPRTRTGEALFALPERSRVVAGMYLRGTAQLAPRETLAAPQSSILYEDGAPYVFVVQTTRRGGDDEEHYIVQRANVRLGARAGDLVEIVEGLGPGQSVVGAGAAFLQSGDEVRPLAPEQPAQAAATPAEPTALRARSD